ncbi:MAG: ABC transporter ATP-binding protein [Desulfosalsimonadaceae bacterium]|nr:ABC transporter ATP-binding protein [Desulfosalsimonadaceae bacterium]
MNPVIEVRNVHKSFKNVQAVAGVDFEILKGQSVALLGPNGAGKTTLMEMIEGIQKPDAGEILVLGKVWKGNEDALHRQIGLSLQETHFLDRLTVRETLILFASFYDLNRDRVDEIVDIIDLAEKSRSYVVNLSGGQRQRLAIGIALLNRPRLLLLDEPTTGLDPNARREIWSILLRLKQQSRTSLILTTHYMEEAEQLCDRIIIIDHGRILKKGTLAQLLETEDGPKIIEFTLEAPAAMDVRGPSRFHIQWAAGRDKGSVILPHIETELPEFLAFLRQHHLRLKSLECRRKTLDDLFIEMTGRRLDE